MSDQHDGPPTTEQTDEAATEESPSLPPQYQTAGYQQRLAEQLAEQAERLAAPAANLDPQGAPHFLRNVDGEEVCGTDGRPWPCEAYQAIAAKDDRVHQVMGAQSGNPAGYGLSALPTMAEAAEAAGMDLAEFEARLRQNRGH